MEAQFWHQRWSENRIGFHQGAVNPHLIAHFHRLSLPPAPRIFVPLSGKTRDISWLMAQGAHVVAAELSRIAIDQLFVDLDLTPNVSSRGPLLRYRADGIDVFVGDIFDLTKAATGPIDATYDRAALVALPADTRARYADHVADITNTAPQLVITFRYDQRQMVGPPFSIESDEITRCYATHYTLSELEDAAVEGGLKGIVPARETVWHLT